MRFTSPPACCIAEGKTQQEVEAEDKEEEEEAKNIQRRLAANLSEEDYDLNLFQVDNNVYIVLFSIYIKNVHLHSS